MNILISVCTLRILFCHARSKIKRKHMRQWSYIHTSELLQLLDYLHTHSLIQLFIITIKIPYLYNIKNQNK